MSKEIRETPYYFVVETATCLMPNGKIDRDVLRIRDIAQSKEELLKRMDDYPVHGIWVIPGFSLLDVERFENSENE